MKICAMSDLHGFLPKSLPECDIILLAGDICPLSKAKRQLFWMEYQFKKWLIDVGKPVFACAGNHDWPLAENREKIESFNLPWTYLQDEFVEYEGLKIYGTPWQRRFYDWAFNLEEHQLMGKWNLIPDDVDILICHSPPKYYGDMGSNGFFLGSESLTWRIQEISPKLVVFGHIHEGRGQWQFKGTTLANVTMLDGKYRQVHSPFVIEI